MLDCCVARCWSLLLSNIGMMLSSVEVFYCPMLESFSPVLEYVIIQYWNDVVRCWSVLLSNVGIS